MADTQLSLFPWLKMEEEVQLELFDPSNESTCLRRQTNVDEQVYAEIWTKENTRRNEEAITLLEGIMRGDDEAYVPFVSDRDSIVAASVIQWLGTNCGSSFIWQCEDRIAKLKAIRKKATRFSINNKYEQTPPVTNIREMVDVVCAQYFPKESHVFSTIRREILSLVLNLLKNGLPWEMKAASRRPSSRVLLPGPPLPTAKEPTIREVQDALDEIQKEQEA